MASNTQEGFTIFISCLSQKLGSRSEHNVGAVKLGFGGFSLAISLLPPRLLRLLSVLGFPCDRVAGLDSIDQCLRGGGLRAPVGGVYAFNPSVPS